MIGYSYHSLYKLGITIILFQKSICFIKMPIGSCFSFEPVSNNPLHHARYVRSPRVLQGHCFLPCGGKNKDRYSFTSGQFNIIIQDMILLPPKMDNSARSRIYEIHTYHTQKLFTGGYNIHSYNSRICKRSTMWASGRGCRIISGSPFERIWRGACLVDGYIFQL